MLDYPKYGCVNVHGSLLPAYRGAAPMQRAIIDGCAETGITTMFMDVGLDTGDMLLKKSVAIDLHDTFETVHDKLGECGAELLLRTLALLEAGEITPEKQDDALATYAQKIEKEDCLLDFSRTAKEVHDRIRGLSPIPLSFTHTPDGKLLKVVSSDLCTGKGKPGEVISLENGRITVACGEGAVALLSVLPEGKKRMSAADFINGRRISVGDILS